MSLWRKPQKIARRVSLDKDMMCGTHVDLISQVTGRERLAVQYSVIGRRLRHHVTAFLSRPKAHQIIWIHGNFSPSLLLALLAEPRHGLDPSIHSSKFVTNFLVIISRLLQPVSPQPTWKDEPHDQNEKKNGQDDGL